jgi:hypothetical protein
MNILPPSSGLMCKPSKKQASTAKQSKTETMALELYNWLCCLHICKWLVTNISGSYMFLPVCVSYILKHILIISLALKMAMVTMVESETILQIPKLLTSLVDIFASCYNNINWLIVHLIITDWNLGVIKIVLVNYGLEVSYPCIPANLYNDLTTYIKFTDSTIINFWG